MRNDDWGLMVDLAAISSVAASTMTLLSRANYENLPQGFYKNETEEKMETLINIMKDLPKHLKRIQKYGADK